MTGPSLKAPTASNRLGLDYRGEARRLPAPPAPITDAHLHINGPGAARIYDEVARLYGIARVYSQTRRSDAEAVKAVLGDRVRFLAVPNWGQEDKGHAFRAGYLDDIRFWRERHGARVVKFWAAPRLYELVGGDPADCVPLDSEWRVRQAELAVSLGMMFMAHIADPDTWFKTRYSDAARYRAKRDHYLSLERMLDRFGVPWIGAHMGGSPEDLSLLDDLLTRHPNLYLDTSATKWVVRELSKHPAERVRDFFLRWSGRLLFGSDIVTTDEHLKPRGAGKAHPMGELADSPESAFDLYASRYWALRTMFETGYAGPSPIADPDLKMLEPDKYDDLSGPDLRGLSLPPAALRVLYAGAAEGLLEGWERGSWGVTVARPAEGI